MTDSETRTRRVGLVDAAGEIIKQRLLVTIPTGRADQPRDRTRLDVAADHAIAWAGAAVARDGERGGSRSPVEEEERIEIARVARQAMKDLQQIGILTRRLHRDALDLARLVDRYVETIDPAKLRAETIGPVGCTSCARTATEGKVRIGGHFAPVRPDRPDSGLCNWCYRHRDEDGNPPPVKACHLYHTQGGRAAARFFAELERGAPSRGVA